MRVPHAPIVALACLQSLPAQACGRCAPLVRQDVFNADFLSQLGWLMAPLLVTGVLAWAIARSDLLH